MIKIAFVGDITPGGVFTHKGGISKEVQDYLDTFDLRIGTLEAAFGDGSKLCHIKMGDKSLCTCIYCPDDMVRMLKDMHIDAATLANNHSCDCDLEGLYHTMDVLDAADIAHFGAGRNAEEASRPLVLTKKGKTICLLGYLQEYRYLYNGKGYHPSETVGGVNILLKTKVIEDIKQYKAEYDYVFVLPHWGLETSAVPYYDESVMAREMIEAGADGVIGSHAHIVQPVVSYKKGLIAMNLGNFAFPDRYVTPPRISYYPTEEELKRPIPQVKSFKSVNEITLKIVAEKERVGAIIAVELQASGSISYKVCYTRLNEENKIVFTDVPISYHCYRRFLQMLVSHNLSLLHKILSFCCKIPRIPGKLEAMRRKYINK